MGSMINLLIVLIIILSVILGVLLSLLYIGVISPEKRKKVKAGIRKTAPKRVSEFVNFLTYDGREQEWTEE